MIANPAGGTAGNTTFLRGDGSWQAISSGWVGTATSDLNMGGTANAAIGDIVDINRLCLNIKAHGFDTDGTNNADISGESEIYVRQLLLADGVTVDPNNDGLFARIKKNGSNVILQIA